MCLGRNINIIKKVKINNMVIVVLKVEINTLTENNIIKNVESTCGIYFKWFHFNINILNKTLKV